MNQLRTFAGILTLLVLAASVRAEMVDNDEYTSWAAHKPGTKVTLKNEVAMGAMNMATSVTHTLLEVKPDEAVVEIATTIDMGGMKQEQKTKRSIKAKIDSASKGMPEGITGTMKEVGKETIEIAGKKYECIVTEFTGKSENGDSSGKVWSSAEVPGRSAKMEIKMTSGPQSVDAKMNVTAIELK